MLCQIVRNGVYIAAFIAALMATSIDAYAYRYSPNEGPFTLSARAGWAIYNQEQEYTVLGIPVEQSELGFFDNNFNVELEGRYFVNDHFSFSSSIGYIANQAVHVIRNSDPSVYDKNKISLFPTTLMAQIHFAPHGQIRPYLGAGYHYTFIDNGLNLIQTDNRTSGFVLQGGVDIWLSQYWAVAMDVKYYDMDFDMDLSDLAGLNYLSDITLNPTIFSAGLAYRF